MAESLKVNGLEATDEAVQKLADALVQGCEDAPRRTGHHRTGCYPVCGNT
jgi:hypothetical protein